MIQLMDKMDRQLPQTWERLGLIYRGRAFLPTPFRLSHEIVRLYVAFLDDENVGRLGYIDVKADDPRVVVAVSNHVALDCGKDGAFDDNGVTPMCLIRTSAGLWLYYTGWQLTPKVRYMLFTGVAESSDGGETFRRLFDTPLLDRITGELIVRTAAFVLPDENKFRCWYIGGSDTIYVNGKQLPSYSLRHAESEDGLIFSAPRELLAPDPAEDEFGFGRPWVRKNLSGYEMWYSIRYKQKG